MVFNIKPCFYSQKCADMIYNERVSKINKYLDAKDTYSFEVEDYHTCYVADSDVLVHNDCAGTELLTEFNEWLNKGEHDTSVYKALDKHGNEIYTGITKQNPQIRLAQHNSPGGGAKGFAELKIKYSNLTRNQARFIETYLINQDRGINLIRSVGSNNRFYSEAIQWARYFINIGSI